jgi:hypothetical protein
MEPSPDWLLTCLFTLQTCGYGGVNAVQNEVLRIYLDNQNVKCLADIDQTIF